MSYANNKGGYDKRPRVVIFTSLFGNYDWVKEPLYRDESVQYLLFTDDKNLRSNQWSIKIVENPIQNPRSMARKYKILSHKFLPDHDISVYLDASILLTCKNIYQMVEECLEENEIALYKHSRRHCTYREIRHCIRVGIERPEIAGKVKNRYLLEGFPYGFGLFETGFIIRRNSENIRTFNEMWWDECTSGSLRDQFSIMYCLWKLGIKANGIKVGSQIRRNPYFRLYRHGK